MYLEHSLMEWDVPRLQTHQNFVRNTLVKTRVQSKVSLSWKILQQCSSLAVPEALYAKCHKYKQTRGYGLGNVGP